MGCNTSKVSPDNWASYEEPEGTFAWANLRTGELTYEPHPATWHVDVLGRWTNRWTGQTFPVSQDFDTSDDDVPVATAEPVAQAHVPQAHVIGPA